jgi:hypothetical protein
LHKSHADRQQCSMAEPTVVKEQSSTPLPMASMSSILLYKLSGRLEWTKEE